MANLSQTPLEPVQPATEAVALPTIPPGRAQSVPGETPQGPGKPAARAAGDVIDWDVRIETPPPRLSRTMAVRFVDGGRRLPRISEDLED